MRQDLCKFRAYFASGNEYCEIDIADPDGNIFVMRVIDGDAPDPRHLLKLQGERIADCLNFCAGIPDEIIHNWELNYSTDMPGVPTVTPRRTE